mgnify:CR=1 FL=1
MWNFCLTVLSSIDVQQCLIDECILQEGSQETAATLSGMILGMLLANLTAGHTVAIWICFLSLTCFHMYGKLDIISFTDYVFHWYLFLWVHAFLPLLKSILEITMFCMYMHYVFVYCILENFDHSLSLWQHFTCH